MSNKPVLRSTSVTWQTIQSNIYDNSSYEEDRTSLSSYIQSQVGPSARLFGKAYHDVYHWKTTQYYSGPIIEHKPGSPGFTYAGDLAVRNYPAHPDNVRVLILEALRLRDQLTTDDIYGGFSGIEFIKELDKVLGLFDPRRYFTYSGYGQMKWGLKPFLDDITALRDSLTRYLRLSDGRSHTQRFNKKFPFYLSRAATSSNGLQVFKGDIKFNGEVTIEPIGSTDFLSQLFLFLDSLQLNPDLLTAWELTPYSFVVDYYVPISKLVESVTNRGYGTYNVKFTGFVSVKGDYRFAGRFNGQFISEFYENSATAGEGSYYVRDFVSQFYTVTPGLLRPKPVNGPSMQNLLDTAYVASQLVKRK